MWFYDMKHLGYNYRMSDIHAALGFSQLNKLDKFVKERNKIAKNYFKLNINGKSEFFYSDSHNNKSKSYQLLNLTFGRSKGRFTSELWMRNVFDKYYSTRGR